MILALRNKNKTSVIDPKPQCNDYEFNEVNHKPNPMKIFNVCKIQKQNLLLMRNKIPKVFWINKYKYPKIKAPSNYQKEEEEEVPIRRIYRGIYKIERFAHPRKRLSARQRWLSKFHSRISNDYSDDIKFKIEKIQRELIKPFALKRYPNKKNPDIESASTKRSSRESSNHKITSSNDIQNSVNQINLVKVEKDDTPVKLIDEPFGSVGDLMTLNKAQNLELEHEIQSHKLHEQLEEVMKVPKVVINPENPPVDFESLSSSYPLEDFDQVYEETEKLPKCRFGDFSKIGLRPRLVSGCNEISVIEVNDNSSFLLGSERETPNFEPFATNKLFSNTFAYDNSKNL